MPIDSTVSARVDSTIKAQATAALAAMGLTVSDVVRVLLHRVAEEQRIPFEIKVPNADTIEAGKELDSGGGTRVSLAEFRSEFGL